MRPVPSLTLFAAASVLLLPGCRTQSNLRDAAQPPPPHGIHYTSEPMTIDGKLDEPAWDQAALLPFFVYQEHHEPISLTQAGMLWDDQYLYVGFRTEDKDVYGYFQDRDASTASEDVLEIFFNTHPERTAYYNFEINALGTVYDAYSPQWAFAGHTHRWKRWNCEGLKIGIQIRGTLNQWKDVDEGWDLEVAIPFAELETLGGGPPQPGDVWTFHLARYDYSVHLPENGRETSSTALFHEPVGGFHDQTGWGRLQFLRP